VGEGSGAAFSPDGKFVLAISNQTPRQLILYPVGAGESRQITNDALQHESACWLPDGRGILFVGANANSRHIYVQSLAGGAPRRIGPDGLRLARHAASPDGRTILVRSGERIGLLSMEGGEPRMLPDVLAGASPLRWNGQGNGFYFVRGRSSRVYEYNLATEKIRELPYRGPERQRGTLHSAAISSDGRAYAVDYANVIGDLYVLSGLQ
jgi:Tol biopolymer transport system component